jgi:hypothetical protein
MFASTKLVEKLEGVENFCSWKYRIEILIEENDLEKFVKGEIMEPDDAVENAKHQKDTIRAKRIIADSIKDHMICWLWSLIIFLIQRSLLSAVFIPHEVFTPQKYVHSSTRRSAEEGYPLFGVQWVHPPGWGV